MTENIHQNKINARVVFQITPKNSGLLAFSNGDVQLDLPEKNENYKKLVQAIAKFANEFVIENFSGVLTFFKSSEMLTASNGLNRFIYYCVYTDDLTIDKTILADVEDACRQFLYELYEIDQNDLLSKNISNKNKTWSNEIKNIAEDFKKRNKNFDLNNPVSITSDINPEPVSLVARIKSTTVSSSLEAEPYKINALAEGFKIIPKKIFVYEILFDSSTSKEISLIAENIEIFNKAKEIIAHSQFLRVRIIERLASDSLKKVKYFDEIEAWEGPKGPLC